ncbi:PREDICTED: zinc finger BED domain-containing protein RICESLEEPER 1-like [Ipomoea nil]|uniref:zinc finger BED domain-containing protein RICESLEEPER 1-like n=1 Tax=Ipomoea nil TaxID=35883 RepID=UPI000900F7DA|nr:PREDICTED: zinc finger BED domain-containing protein RICESLEEPER 1-like [Ipomoea nil]
MDDSLSSHQGNISSDTSSSTPTEPIEESVGQKKKMYNQWTSTETKCSKVRGGSSQLVAVGFNQEACRRATVKMIILDELPFCFVDGDGFKQFCIVACPKFIIPSRRIITRDVVELFMKEKALLKSVISESRLHRKIISFKPISDHKGETFAKELENCLIDWGITKVFTITVDNASANDSALRIFKTKVRCWREDPLILGGEFLHVCCCAHILILIVKDGLAVVGNSVVSVRNAVKYVRSSNCRFQAFQIRAEQDNLSRGSLILDCNTRWNSTYLMLTAAFKYKAAFDRMANEDKLYDDYFKEDENGKRKFGPPSSIDWENVRRLVQFLKIFSDATLSFSSYKTVTSSHCFDDICTIEVNLNVFSTSKDVNMSGMALEMKKKFDKYWEGSEINKLLIVSSVLDPRSKMSFVTIFFEKLYGKDTPKCSEMKEAVVDVMRKLYEVYSAFYAKPSATTSQSGGGSESGCESICATNIK